MYFASIGNFFYEIQTFPMKALVTIYKNFISFKIKHQLKLYMNNPKHIIFSYKVAKDMTHFCVLSFSPQEKSILQLYHMNKTFSPVLN